MRYFYLHLKTKLLIRQVLDALSCDERGYSLNYKTLLYIKMLSTFDLT